MSKLCSQPEMYIHHKKNVFQRKNIMQCRKQKRYRYIWHVFSMTDVHAMLCILSTTYTSTVWSPHLLYQIQKLEKVQHSAACFITNDFSCYSSVTSMLDQLQWPLLEHRRFFHMVLFTSILLWLHLQHLPMDTATLFADHFFFCLGVEAHTKFKKGLDYTPLQNSSFILTTAAWFPTRQTDQLRDGHTNTYWQYTYTWPNFGYWIQM